MRSRLIRDIGAGFGLAAAIVLGTGATAFAHECINSSRSDKGNEKAGSNSQAWFTIHVEDALAGDVADGLITGDQAECILEEYSATGSPMSFTIHVKGATGQNGTIGANNPNDERMSDGRGIDHFIDMYGGAIFGSYVACGAELEL